VRKKMSAAGGLVTVATAGALFVSTPAYAAEDAATLAPAVSSVAPATAGQQASVSTGTPTLAADGHRRRHWRRHHRYHRRHFRHHRRHYRHRGHYRRHHRFHRSWY
jgi:Ni/Co efflux regulator RcnB